MSQTGSMPLGTMVQVTTTRGVLTSLNVYAFTGLYVGDAPGVILSATDLRRLFTERIVNEGLRDATAADLNHLMRAAERMGGSYAVFNDAFKLGEYFGRLYAEQSYRAAYASSLGHRLAARVADAQRVSRP